MSQRRATATPPSVTPSTIQLGTMSGYDGPTQAPSTSTEELKNRLDKPLEGGHRKRTTSHENPLVPGAGQEEMRKFWVFRAASKGDLIALARAITNTVASIGFAVGSFLWVIDDPRIIAADTKTSSVVLISGTMIFFAANVLFVLTGISWVISAKRAFHHKYTKKTFPNERKGESEPVVQPGSVPAPALNLREEDISPSLVDAFRILLYFEILAASCQMLGGVAFNIGCILSLFGYPGRFFIETNSFWLLGSEFFLAQGIMSQIMCASFIGPILPLVARFHRFVRTFEPAIIEARRGTALTPPLRKCCTTHSWCVHRCIPACLFNTSGSLIFVISSIFLFYEPVAIYGAWGYLFGSIFYCFANWADTLGFLDTLALRLVSERLAKHNLILQNSN